MQGRRAGAADSGVKATVKIPKGRNRSIFLFGRASFLAKAVIDPFFDHIIVHPVVFKGGNPPIKLLKGERFVLRRGILAHKAEKHRALFKGIGKKVNNSVGIFQMPGKHKVTDYHSRFQHTVLAEFAGADLTVHFL